jgi:hypothetical protein
LSRSSGTRLHPTTLRGQRRFRRIRIGAVILLGVAPLTRAHGAPEPSAIASPPCPPAAVVQGPPEIVHPIVAILRGHGVTSGPGACSDRMVNASLANDRDTGGYRLHVRDAVGHSSDRRVTDAATAASLIESWALAEDADLLAPPTTSPDAGDVAAVAPAPPARGPAAHIGLGPEMSISSDDSVWWGGRATGCARIGVLCVGGRAGFARTYRTPASDSDPTPGSDLTRTLTDVSALVAWPVRSGRLWATPSLALGGAWLHSRASLAPLSATTDDFLVRAELGVAAGVTIRGAWSVAADLGGALGATLGSSGREGATAVYMPAPPRAFFRAGVGVWYGP